jgi:NAD(P)-dependent dehydrogenase (short-subunit alcohol dehydrogenase family)
MLLALRRVLTTFADPAPTTTLFEHEFSLADRVALVSGGNRGLGLEMALALIEAGARAVYCVDLPSRPSEEWQAVRTYAARLANKRGEGRLEYVSGNVTDQVRMSCELCPGGGRQDG